MEVGKNRTNFMKIRVEVLVLNTKNHPEEFISFIDYRLNNSGFISNSNIELSLNGINRKEPTNPRPQETHCFGIKKFNKARAETRIFFNI